MKLVTLIITLTISSFLLTGCGGGVTQEEMEGKWVHQNDNCWECNKYQSGSWRVWNIQFNNDMTFTSNRPQTQPISGTYTIKGGTIEYSNVSIGGKPLTLDCYDMNGVISSSPFLNTNSGRLNIGFLDSNGTGTYLEMSKVEDVNHQDVTGF